jgi:hypothetical protein
VIVLASGGGVLVRPIGLGWVYFIENAETKRIKIGHSAKPEARLSDLGVGNDCPLVLLGAIEGGPALEKALHARFRAQRVRGEWFQPAIRPEVLALIREHPVDLETTMRQERQAEEAEKKKRAAVEAHKRRRAEARRGAQSCFGGTPSSRAEDLFADALAGLFGERREPGPRTGLEKAVEAVRRARRRGA